MNWLTRLLIPAVRVVITSVYPNVDYSAPSLAEIDVGMGKTSWIAAEEE